MDTKTLIAKVRKVEIKTKGLSKQLFAGEYHSAFKGRGMSFSEVRDYHYGDNIRNIDWNVSARFGKPFVKVFEEERELTMMLLIDVSQSSFMGSNKEMRHEIIAEIGAVLAFSATQNNDKIGAIFFSDQIELYIPPKKSKGHVLRIIREMLALEPKGKGTNISLALEHLNRVQKKKAISFLISDFRQKEYKKVLSISTKRHDLIGIKINDGIDFDIPRLGFLQIVDPESGKKKWINTFHRKSREQFKIQFQNYSEYFFKTFASTGTDFLEVNIGESYVKSLVRFFKKR